MRLTIRCIANCLSGLTSAVEELANALKGTKYWGDAKAAGRLLNEARRKLSDTHDRMGDEGFGG